jgi:L-asparaginase/Glu-tRNA(Gln) amidotransferase subunit D
MEQTARFLDARFATTLNDTDARVILTGANDDISVATSDAWDNLAFALESADSDAEPGVYVAFHDKLIPARLVVKEPFDGTSMNYTALDDPEYLEAIQKQLKHSQLQVSQLETAYGRKAMSSKVVDYPVNIIRPNHQELLDYIDTHDVETILLTFYHSSTANTEKPEMSVAELAKKLIAKRGIVLFGVTENGEPCRFDGYETSIRLHEAGIVPLGAMLHDVALAKLQLLSETGLVHEPLKAAMLAT